jgi:CxxC motif-containing protein (DUF1111 family)
MEKRIALSLLGVASLLISVQATAQFVARDPGVRRDPPGSAPAAGGPLAGLRTGQLAFFGDGKEAFEEAEGVGDGLGPRFNLDSCGGCHSQPATGGTSPAVNPQVQVATAFGARNRVPSFISIDGPVREARFKYKADGTRDGGVHALFVISGRTNDGTGGDASRCGIEQDNFEAHVSRGNVIFRIPTPTFGAGLIEQIPDAEILRSLRATASLRSSFGIFGRPNITLPTGDPNRNGNDGTIARFGWKAQNKSLAIFSGEAYNVEMGITNHLFPTERDETPGCQIMAAPNDVTDLDAGTIGDVELFAIFMRFLAPPTPSTSSPGGATSIARGKNLFTTVGCALCHTPQLFTGASTIPALHNKPVRLYSDVVLHNMGAGLADDIIQGQAGPDEFRTAPLWGLGQRIFFLHDGRTKDLVEAIRAHKSAATARYRASEANTSVDRFEALGAQQKQDLLNFLRSL